MAVFPADSSVKISSPFSETIQTKTLMGSYGLEARSLRKRRQLYPRRLISVKYENRDMTDAGVLWRFYIARSGRWNMFTLFFNYSDTYVGEFVGIGDGSTDDFDLPFKSGSSITVYVDAVEQTVTTDYVITGLGGTNGEDLITFQAGHIPSDGAKITVSFTGYLKIRAHFAEDNMSKDVFYRKLTSTGLAIQGGLNDE